MTRDEGIERVAPNSANQADNAQQSDNEGQGQQQAQGEQQDGQGRADATPQQEQPGDGTVPEQAYADYTLEYDEEDAVMNGKIPDVLLDIPVVKVDEINFELNDLRAQFSVHAKVLDLVELSIGADVYLGRVKLVIQGIEAQALLKARLDNLTAILDRVLTTIDRNPQIVEKLAESVGSAVEDIGEGAGSAVEDVGSGAGQLVGEGVNSAVEDVGEGAGQLVGEGANQAVADIGSGAGS